MKKLLKLFLKLTTKRFLKYLETLIDPEKSVISKQSTHALVFVISLFSTAKISPLTTTFPDSVLSVSIGIGAPLMGFPKITFPGTGALLLFFSPDFDGAFAAFETL